MEWLPKEGMSEMTEKFIGEYRVEVIPIGWTRKHFK